MVKNLSEYLVREFYNSDEYSYDTINRYLTLILTTELSVEKIALELNFSCAHTFRRAFKDITGLPPGEYRKKHANQNAM